MTPIADRYLRLLRHALVNDLYVELEAQLIYAVLCGSHDEVPELDQLRQARQNSTLLDHLRALKQTGDSLQLKGLNSSGQSVIEPELRNFGEFAHTLIGHERLVHLQQCIETIDRESIGGDLLQAGCWRGGSAVFMRGVLAALDCTGRKLWVADSFAGLPPSTAGPDQGYEMDAGRFPVLSVPLDEVRDLFERYELLDQQVEFLVGWFADSLAHSPPGPLALLHVDADLYQSTLDVLNHCHERVTPGGFVVIDDYGILPPCREAVDEFLSVRGLAVDLIPIGEHAVCWRA